MKQHLILCIGFLASLTLFMSQAAAAAVAFPPSMTGAFEALLVEGDEESGLPAAKVEINVLSTGKFTGKLTFTEKTSPALTGTFTLSEDSNSADVVNGLTLKRTGLPDLKLELKLLSTSVLEARLSVPSAPATPLRLSTQGVKIKTFAVKELSPWANIYTLSLSYPTPTGAANPAGHGYAAVKIDAKGIMTLTGKTGDGIALTGKCLPAADGSFRVFLKPYGAAVSDNYLTGWLILESRSDNKFHIPTGSTASELYWRKPATKPSDKQYRSGFGPLAIAPVLTPWTAPKAPQTLGGILGIDPGEVFDIDFSSAFSTTTYAARTPVRLGLTAKNLLTVAQGGSGSPSPFLPANWSKLFSIKVNPATGVLTGSLTLYDEISTPQPFPKLPIVKKITRKVILEGVLHQLLTLDAGDFAHGYVLVPPLDPKTATQISGAFSFNGPVVADPLVAASANIPGTYTVQLTQLPNGGLPLPSGIPANNATVNFSISSDLKTMVFNGRTIPLTGDSRPVSLVFGDAKKSPTNNLTVIAFLDFSGTVTHLSVMYFQASRPLPKQVYFNTVNGSVVKQVP